MINPPPPAPRCRTGSRQPSPAFSRSIDQFSRYGALAKSVVFIDASAAAEDYFKGAHNVIVHRIVNLSTVIHLSADAMLPELAAHERRRHYPLGRKLSDFRWMFGAIFQQHLAEFTHWAWVDAHDFAGDLFGAVTQHGADLARFDIVSFTSIDGSVKNDPHVSGYMAVLHNDERGRNLFRRCASLVPSLLETEMVGGGNDEVHCSDDLLRAPGVTAALIEGAWRYPQHVLASVKGEPHLVYAPPATTHALPVELSRIPLLSSPPPPPPPPRVNDGAGVDALRSLHRITLYSYKRRNKGAWPNPRPLSEVAPAWFTGYAEENPDDYPDGKHARGFGSMLRDDKGQWWLRPFPPSLLLTRNGSLAGFDVPLAHSRPPVQDFQGTFGALLEANALQAPVADLPRRRAYARCC